MVREACEVRQQAPERSGPGTVAPFPGPGWVGRTARETHPMDSSSRRLTPS
jgi:hypothetical protein